MTAFTTLTAGENALSLAMANEIVLAYSERRQALGQDAVSSLAAGTDARDKTLWLAMQTWMEVNCTSFVDSSTGSVQLNPAGDGFLYFTLATWRSAAGLNASGFRRSTDGVNFSYGNIQAGDVWGKWTFEDLQKGFAALKWSIPVESPSTDGFERTAGGLNQSSIAAAIAAAQSMWSSQSWSEIDRTPRAVCELYKSWIGDGSYTIYCKRRKRRFVYPVAYFGLPRTLEFYANFITTTYNNDVLIPQPSPIDFYFNAQSDDVTEDASIELIDTVSDSTDANITIDYIFDNDNAPVNYNEPAEPSEEGGASSTSSGYEMDSFAALIKWSFTNS